MDTALDTIENSIVSWQSESVKVLDITNKIKKIFYNIDTMDTLIKFSLPRPKFLLGRGQHSPHIFFLFDTPNWEKHRVLRVQMVIAS